TPGIRQSFAQREPQLRPVLRLLPAAGRAASAVLAGHPHTVERPVLRLPRPQPAQRGVVAWTDSATQRVTGVLERSPTRRWLRLQPAGGIPYVYACAAPAEPLSASQPLARPTDERRGAGMPVASAGRALRLEPDPGAMAGTGADRRFFQRLRHLALARLSACAL